MLVELLNAIEETLFMVFTAGLLTFFIGLSLGTLLAVTSNKQMLANPLLHKSLNILIKSGCAVPYLIIILSLIPILHFSFAIDHGCTLAIVPLSLATVPAFAKLCSNAMLALPLGLSDMAKSLGASPFQILRKVLFAGSFTKIMQGFILTLTHLVGYSVIAGAFGNGGLGALILPTQAEFQINFFFASSVLLVLLIQIIQRTGHYFLGNQEVKQS